MSKIQNSINIYLLIWRRSSRPTQDLGNCHVLKVQHCDVTAVVTDTVVCSKRQLPTSAAELMLLTTWLDCGKRVIRQISNAGSRASYGSYSETCP